MTRLLVAAAASLLSLLALGAGCSSPDSAVAGEGAALDLGLDAGTATWTSPVGLTDAGALARRRITPRSLTH